jgi:hypothetical protein
VPKTLRHFEFASSQTWIIVNDDGTVTRRVEAASWLVANGESEVFGPLELTLTADEAKAKWPLLAREIDAARDEISGDGSTRTKDSSSDAAELEPTMARLPRILIRTS